MNPYAPIHFIDPKNRQPVCGHPSAGVTYSSKDWKNVTCTNCKEFNKHKWVKGADMSACSRCGLIMGSGFDRCVRPKEAKSEDQTTNGHQQLHGSDHPGAYSAS